jgi:3-hydroxybutyryl-CoA dehydrogenase
MAVIPLANAMDQPERIAVIGSGLMGHGIAQIFAVHGHAVVVIDPNQDSLQTVPERIRANLNLMAEHHVRFADPLETILARVALSPEMAAARNAAFVIEAVFEDMQLKQKVFAELDRICPPSTILCSNTSVMSISEIASLSQHRERIVGTHFWNPPFLIPLVEVVKAADTAEQIVDATYELFRRVGKYPVKVWRDVPGFVANRLQHALWREAFAIIDEGICDPATVDECLRYGPGLRLPVLGPVENADMVGLDLIKAIHAYLFPHLNAAPTPSATLLEHVARGELGFKSGQGFMQWSEEDKAASRQRLLTYLLRYHAQDNPGNK